MKKTVSLVLAVILLMLVVIFTLQNTQAVRIDVFFWGFESSLALIIFATFTAGFLLGMLALLPRLFRSSGNGNNNSSENGNNDESRRNVNLK